MKKLLTFCAVLVMMCGFAMAMGAAIASPVKAAEREDVAVQPTYGDGSDDKGIDGRESLDNLLNPFPETFGTDGGTCSGSTAIPMPAGWTTAQGNAGPAWTCIKGAAGHVVTPANCNYVQVRYLGSYDDDAWLFTPGVALIGGTTYTLSFW